MKPKNRRMRRSSKHPSYPFPVIREALCEIHFELPKDTAWKPSFAGEFFKRIQPDFPEMEPGVEIGVHFEVSPERLGHSLMPPRQRMRFRHWERPLLLQLGQHVFTVNVLAQYPGWETMCQDAVDGWTKLCEIVKPIAISRIGLRYINCVQRQSAADTPGRWWRASDYVPAAVLTSRGPFLSRVESHLDQDNRVIVTLAEVPSDPPVTLTGFAFDIDRIVEKSLSVDTKPLLSELNRLHDDVWAIFNSAKTQELDTLLEGGGK